MQQQAPAEATIEKEKRPYERTNYRLPYTHPKGFENARPQPRAPYAVRRRRPFVVNDDPHKLDAMYTKLFGREMKLPDEVKWQAVTHKSFDHGRQPFNEKLRFLGMDAVPRLARCIHSLVY
jgi:hypothetical protein